MAEISFGGQSETDHDLPLQIVKRVEGVKELFLRAFFPGDELNIVHEENIDRAEAVAKADHAVKAQRIDHFVGEFFGADIREPRRRIALLDQVADRLHQVRLAHSHSAIEKQRVVGLGGLLGDGLGRRVRELIRRANDKGCQIGSGDSADDRRNQSPGAFAWRDSPPAPVHFPCT